MYLESEDELHLSNEMSCALRLLDVKSRCNLTDDAFHQIMTAVSCSNISLYKTKMKLKSIVQIEPILVDMCPNSCCAYTGDYKYYNKCKECDTPRFQSGSSDHPRRQMAYFSIKNRLMIQYQDPTRSEELKYRANYIQRQGFGSNGKINDIFDGIRYNKLLSDGFFRDYRDIALIGSVDGYQIFRQKTDDCWVVLMINANICPENRVKRENLMITAIIPGPKEPKQFNSFMHPIIKELRELEGIYIIYNLILLIVNHIFN